MTLAAFLSPLPVTASLNTVSKNGIVCFGKHRAGRLPPVVRSYRIRASISESAAEITPESGSTSLVVNSAEDNGVISKDGMGKAERGGLRERWREGLRFMLLWLSVAAKRIRTARKGRVGQMVMLATGLFLMCAFRGRIGMPGTDLTSAVVAVPSMPQINLPSWLINAVPASMQGLVRPFGEAFGVVFLSEFGDKSMFATALMAMKQNPVIVFVGALVSLTSMTLIACFLGQFMQLLPAKVTHYSSIALFVFFGLQMILQSRKLPKEPNGKGSERADAEELVNMSAGKKGTVLAKVCSLIFVAEWCDRSMLATMALAASSNTLAVVGGATVANIICTGLAVVGAALISSKISERVVALVSGILFEVFAVFTFLEGPES